MAEGYSLVKTVVQVLNDGGKGFTDLGEKLKNPESKAFFLHEATHRGAFAKELEAELALAAGDTKDIAGTVGGAIHRTWGDLKASLGGSDHTLLETAEQGEDAAKKAYKEALEATDLPSTKIRQLLVTQQAHIQASHDKVKALRDSTAS
ncbi:PA2169 family four-helix-bundle protein [Granulicella arctica]|uniref:PA2169 family four-helix-bundle protein n=1 Tax=Granulicella arctica TaxID=940613 RepID=UPI0021DFE7C3|nr:PA2169 family four-helix-bundle protein [Granulicella arctica]